MALICVLLFAMAALGAQSLAAEVEKSFIENEIVPDVLTIAPKKVLNVSFIRYFFNEFQDALKRKNFIFLTGVISKWCEG